MDIKIFGKGVNLLVDNYGGQQFNNIKELKRIFLDRFDDQQWLAICDVIKKESKFLPVESDFWLIADKLGFRRKSEQQIELDKPKTKYNSKSAHEARIKILEKLGLGSKNKWAADLAKKIRMKDNEKVKEEK